MYPLLKRLEKEGLVATKEDKSDGRGRKLLTVTAKGRSSIKDWVVSGADDEIISSVTDPVRSRMFFLGALSATEQGDYINKLIVLMEAHLSHGKTHLDGETETGDLYDYLGSMGAVKLAEARLEWLKMVRKRLSEADN